ncbi:type III restriction endonuclease subunit M [Anaerosporomusa subterranea]|uniref:Type III restriction endonuclease subunit M n=1 Tax=Anaerosporomusa subterranea TaxID=1794912 RepID=A0A154BVD7_ANASB|nr:site-specific DNA-methyltransferase [Anaerosporomusa subterranea]KYZ77825.1 type III restriction endonuclease subunit M [Anaerosporomusa subterranea]
MEKLKMASMNMTQKNIERIEALFPQVITEMRDETGHLKKVINFEKLKQELSDDIIDGEECYDFTWVGKKAAIVEGNTPIRKTLRPCLDESKDWESTGNLYIEGDNLEVLKLLQESYLNSIKMIYIDPPYNTGRDSFVYTDNFKIDKDEFEEQIEYRDEAGNIQFRQNNLANPRFHSDWCSMLYPRLKLAQSLLREDGVIFISIDDNEVHNLRKICDEIFGEANFVGCAGRITKKSNNKGDYWAPNFDYLLTYVKDINHSTTFFGGLNHAAYNMVDEDGPRKGERYQLVRLYMSTIQNRNPEQRFWIECPDGSKIIPPGSTFPPERPALGDGIWRWTRKKFEEEKDRIVIKKVRSSNLLNQDGNPAQWNVYTKTYLQDVIDNSSAKPNSFIEGHINQIGSHEVNSLSIPFDYSKPSTLIKYLMEVSKTNEDSIILDFFSGSATTADAVMQLNAEDAGNRKFIMVQIPEACDAKSEAFKAGYKTISEIGKERIRRAGQRISENLNSQLEIDEQPQPAVDIGFRVLKIDSTNMKDVYYAANEYSQSMLAGLESNIKEDRTDLDLLYGVLLDWGLPLSLSHKMEAIDAVSVHTVDEGALIACFAEKISEHVVREIARRRPLRVVLRDSSFANSSDKINVEEIFKLHAPTTTVKVI